jgi:hypothetical protein
MNETNQSIKNLIEETKMSELQLRKDKTEINVDQIDIRITERESSVGNLKIGQRNISEELTANVLHSNLRLNNKMLSDQAYRRDDVQNILLNSK